MDRRRVMARLLAAATATATGCLGPVSDGGEDNAEGNSGFAVETVAEGLTQPWGVEFLDST
ncbi:MAG: PQQ-dependent sugar dehydrogenase, partial [Halobacteriales archaeon]